MIGDEIVELDSLDSIIEDGGGLGSIKKAPVNVLKGINATKTGAIVQQNSENVGYTFFTRPELRLTDDNLVNTRLFGALLNNNPNSMERYVRTILDPHLLSADNKLATPLVNNELGFIPVFTNSIKSITGFPDVVMETYTSKPGIAKEETVLYDGKIENHAAYDLDVTFANMSHEPVSKLVTYWMAYGANVTRGIFMPYMSSVVRNAIDYQTRIYRFVMDPLKTRIVKYSCTGTSIPVNMSFGKFFDIPDDKPMVDTAQDITIRFKSTGVMYNDPIILLQFNRMSGMFSPDIRKLNTLYVNASPEVREMGLSEHPETMGLLDIVKVHPLLKEKYNYLSYPWVNLYTGDLEWWVKKKFVEEMSKETVIKLKDFNDAT